jgi:hypothetical protein
MRAPDHDRGFGGLLHSFTKEQAVNACQDAVRRQALDRFRGRGVEFREIRLDDSPGRNDWVIGNIDVLRGPDSEGHFRFSCSVNFDTGEVRSAQIDADRFDRHDGDRHDGDRMPDRDAGARDRCRRAVEGRMHRDGFDRIEVESIHRDEGSGRGEWLIGVARAEGDHGPREFNFSCSVDPRDGDIRSVDVTRR